LVTLKRATNCRLQLPHFPSHSLFLPRHRRLPCLTRRAAHPPRRPAIGELGARRGVSVVRGVGRGQAAGLAVAVLVDGVLRADGATWGRRVRAVPAGGEHGDECAGPPRAATLRSPRSAAPPSPRRCACRRPAATHAAASPGPHRCRRRRALAARWRGRRRRAGRAGPPRTATAPAGGNE
ncbi:hypothetical protein BAE44_0017437, partial [Dichanthelium oligosanthes]